MDISNLTPEQRERVKACKTTAEVIELAMSEGIELSDEEIDGIAGGSSWSCDVDDGGYY